MLVYDANANSGNTAGFESTYTTFKSDNPTASPENPILVLDNAEKQWDETSLDYLLILIRRQHLISRLMVNLSQVTS